MAPWKVACILAVLIAGGAAYLVGLSFDPPAAPPPPNKEEAKPVSCLCFDKTEAQVVVKSPAAKHEFLFRNTSGSVVVLKAKLRTTCNCSTANLAKTSYAPGESGSIVLEVNATAQAAGPKGYSATVEYEDAKLPPTRLVLVVVYDPDVLVVPSELSLTLVAGKSATARFRMIDSRHEPFVLDGAETSAAFLRVAALPQAQGAEGRGRRELEVTAKDDGLPFGKTQASVTVRAKDGTAWTLLVSVEKIQRIRTAPSALYLARTPDGGAEGRLFVSDIEDEPVSLRVEGEGIEASIDKEPKSRQIVILRAKRADSLRFPLSLKIIVERPCRQETTVTIAGLSSSSPRP